MATAMKRRPLPTLAAAALLALLAGCGAGTESTPTESPSTPSSTESPPPEQAQALPGLPTRSVSLDHFALEGAVGTGLAEGDGVDSPLFTTWEFAGERVDVRMEVWRWFSPAEAQASCAGEAGGGAVQSLALGSPTWTTDVAVYVTQGPSCVRVTVLRGLFPDVPAASGVATLLVQDDAALASDDS
jgi:hypothetical protein